MKHKYEKCENKQRIKFVLMVAFLILMIGLIIINFLSFRSYQNMGILTIIPFDSLLCSASYAITDSAMEII